MVLSAMEKNKAGNGTGGVEGIALLDKVGKEGLTMKVVVD